LAIAICTGDEGFSSAHCWQEKRLWLLDICMRSCETVLFSNRYCILLRLRIEFCG
jgi:hypothetical protein